MTKQTHTTQDDRLAEFADELLMGEIQQTASSADPELARLEETLLRLSKAFPPVTLTEDQAKRMRNDLKKRIAANPKDHKETFWAKWFGFQQAPQLGMTFVVAALMVALIVLSPVVFTNTNADVVGTAFSSATSLGIAGILAALIILILWTMRRK